MKRVLGRRPPNHEDLFGLNYIQALEHKRSRRLEKVYCLEKSPLDCNSPVFFYGWNNGGGPLFIDHIFSNKEFLNEHLDCRSCLEVCSGPGFIGFYLQKYLKLDFVNFLDINEEVEKLINKTFLHNNIKGKFFLSDGLNDYTGEKVDLIVMNPPFFTLEDEFKEHIKISGIEEKEAIERSRLITLDKDFKLHTNLINNCMNILNDNGRIVFLEVIKNIPPNKILEKFNTIVGHTIKEFKIQSEIPNYYTLTIYKK